MLGYASNSLHTTFAPRFSDEVRCRSARLLALVFLIDDSLSIVTPNGVLHAPEPA